MYRPGNVRPENVPTGEHTDRGMSQWHSPVSTGKWTDRGMSDRGMSVNRGSMRVCVGLCGSMLFLVIPKTGKKIQKKSNMLIFSESSRKRHKKFLAKKKFRCTKVSLDDIFFKIWSSLCAYLLRNGKRYWHETKRWFLRDVWTVS